MSRVLPPKEGITREVKAPYASSTTQLLMWQHMQKEHHSKCRSAASTCDTTVPSVSANVKLHRAHAASRDFKAREAERHIHKENHKLVKQLSHIAQKPSVVARFQDSGFPQAWKDKGLSLDMTRHRLAKVNDMQEENKKLAGRIRSSRPVMLTYDQEEAFRKHKQALQRIRKVSPPSQQSWGVPAADRSATQPPGHRPLASGPRSLPPVRAQQPPSFAASAPILPVPSRGGLKGATPESNKPEGERTVDWDVPGAEEGSLPLRQSAGSATKPGTGGTGSRSRRSSLASSMGSPLHFNSRTPSASGALSPTSPAELDYHSVVGPADTSALAAATVSRVTADSVLLSLTG